MADYFSPEALAELMDELRPALHRYAARMTGSVVDGEDIVQDVYLRAHGALQSGHQVDRPRAWLFRIAHNTALNFIRARRVEADMKSKLSKDMPSDIPPPNMGAHDSLRSYMGLTPSQRSVVILSDVFGYTAAEVAELTGGNIARVKSTLHRARAALKRAKDDVLSFGAFDQKQMRRLSTYARLFNERAFDELRDMLAAEVRLEVILREKRNGKAAVGNYFSNYDKLADWRIEPGLVEGKPAMLGYDRRHSTVPDYFVLIDIDENGVQAIRDFRYARYTMNDAEWVRIPFDGETE